MGDCTFDDITRVVVNKRINLFGERFLLKIHRNTINYSYFVEVSVSDRDIHQRKKLLPLINVSVRDRNVNKVRIIGCVSMNF